MYTYFFHTAFFILLINQIYLITNVLIINRKMFSSIDYWISVLSDDKGSRVHSILWKYGISVDCNKTLNNIVDSTLRNHKIKQNLHDIFV